MPPKRDPFSYRPTPEQEERIWGMGGGAEGEITRTKIYALALDSFFALLSVNPGMIEGYDPARDPSVTHEKDM